MRTPNWTTCTIAEVATLVKRQVTPGGTNAAHIPYLGLEHIDPGSLRTNGFGKASGVISNKFAFESGDILYGKLRPYFRKCVRPRFSGVCSTDFWVIRSKSERCTQNFLRWVVSTVEFTDFVNSGSTGTRMPRGDWHHSSRYEFMLPDLETQNVITDVLDAIESKILINSEDAHTLEEMSQALFKSWFVDFDPVVAKSEGRKPFGMSDDIAALFPDSFEESELGAVPKGWRVESLENLCEFGSGKRPPTPGFDSCGEIPIIGGGGPMGLCEKPLLTTSALITGRVGTLGLVFRVDYPCWPSDNTLIIYPSPGYFDFVFFVARNADLASLNRGSTQPLLTQGDLRAIRCVKPPEKLVLEFQRLTSVLFAKISATGRETKALQRARDALLPELLGGRIVKSSQLTEATAA